MGDTLLFIGNIAAAFVALFCFWGIIDGMRAERNDAIVDWKEDGGFILLIGFSLAICFCVAWLSVVEAILIVI